MLKRIIVTLVLPFVTLLATAQTQVSLRYNDGVKTIRLDGYEYRPAKWNGKVIIMNHGSANPSRVKDTLRYEEIARQASEGDYTEENYECRNRTLKAEYLEAADQLSQVIEQVKATYGVKQVYLVGHSRGGYLSTVYASEHPADVAGAVNLVGVWSAKCEQRTGFNRATLESSARAYNRNTKLFWVYFDNDQYFGPSMFDDVDYTWLQSTAERNGITFLRYKNNMFQSGHFTPRANPEIWTRDVLPAFNSDAN
jgi:pimeloyl-ACP methyl ester carboxylesterase